MPKLRVDLGDFSFLNFVDTGAVDLMKGSVSLHTRIFFLVLTPNQDAVRLMYYNTFPWPVAQGNNKLQVKRDSLRIM